MGIADRREREKASRRNAIIDAAEKLFFSKGIASTTIDQVAIETELSKATIYLYFKNKEELFCAIAKRGLDILLHMLREAVECEGNGLIKLYNMGVSFYTFQKHYPDYFSILYHREVNNIILKKEMLLSEGLLQQEDEMFAIGVSIIKEGIADGSIRPDVDPEKAALALDGIFAGLIRVVSLEEEHLMKHHNIDAEDLIKYAFELIGHSLISPGLMEKINRGLPEGQCPKKPFDAFLPPMKKHAHPKKKIIWNGSKKKTRFTTNNLTIINNSNKMKEKTSSKEQPRSPRNSKQKENLQ